MRASSRSARLRALSVWRSGTKLCASRNPSGSLRVLVEGRCCHKPSPHLVDERRAAAATAPAAGNNVNHAGGVLVLLHGYPRQVHAEARTLSAAAPDLGALYGTSAV